MAPVRTIRICSAIAQEPESKITQSVTSTSSPTPAAIPASVQALYERECTRLGYTPDGAQRKLVEALDALRTRLLIPQSTSLLNGLLRRQVRAPERGLFVWGGVGRGKTWLMDLFFQSLPFKNKQRNHFHRFMQSVHDELKKHHDLANPLERVADRIAGKTRIICFDEFFVSDIADAMLLGNLFRGLFDRAVTLVATSNVPPDELYKEGLQRARFLPAIRLLKEHTRVLHLDTGTDYRLRLLERSAIWFDSRDTGSLSAMQRVFEAIAGEPGKTKTTLTLNHRRLHPYLQTDDVIWFDFADLCDGPRSQADYIAIARCYHTVFLGNLPVLDAQHDNQARRFIHLVDEFYDRGVKLVIAAAAAVTGIYTGSKLRFEFERTQSRLVEMQSQAYLARPHRP